LIPAFIPAEILGPSVVLVLAFLAASVDFLSAAADDSLDAIEPILGVSLAFALFAAV